MSVDKSMPDAFEKEQALVKKLLREELGASEIKVEEELKLAKNGQDRPLLELTLTDLFTGGQAVETFAPEEFLDAAELGNRIHRLWGRLLKVRLHKQVNRLNEFISQAQGEE